MENYSLAICGYPLKYKKYSNYALHVIKYPVYHKL